MTHPDSERVLLLAPQGRDAEVACRILEAAGMSCHIAKSMSELVREMEQGAGAAILTSEAIPPRAARQLVKALDRQPSWSELPILIFAFPGPDRLSSSFGPLQDRHFTVLDRPIGVKALITAVRGALQWRKRQYQVRNLMAALENRIHERDKFLAILGHELRNPLGAILLASQMIDTSDQELATEHAALIERQSRHLTRLVDDLLELSRVTAGKIVLQKRNVDLNDMVGQTIKTLDDMIRVNGHRVTLTNAPSPVIVDGDPTRLEQITLNLVTNSVKYTPAGGVIDITVENAGDAAVLRVKDNGVGIAPERIETIFGLFTQAENAIGRAQGGMGIGLSLVRNLVELHGGTVSAASDGVGKGSEFVVTLPLARTLTTESKSRTPSSEASGITRSIVLVEDNPDVRMLLQLKLKRLGHHVEAASSGEEGIEKISALRPDLAVVDIGLPGLDGYEVAQRVRAALGDDVFLVALSGFGQPEDKKRAVDAGFDEHLTKPADVSDLEQMLARIPERR